MSVKVTEILNRNKCTGCGLCLIICPVNCISMKKDEEGFLYPIIDNNKCINCGNCKKKCAILSQKYLYNNFEEPQYYAAILRDNDTLKHSSSGGVFIALAKYVILNGGFVCGCIYNEKMEAIHVISNKIDIINRMMGSKYVQSDITECYSEIKYKLYNKCKVLFTGTACQIAALKSYLEKDYEELYLVDILCHGVPSPGLFKQFVNHLSKRGTILDIKFRDKEKNGWGSEHRTSVLYKDKGKKWLFMPAYFSAFFYGLSLRESCYNCKFARKERISDITIGDYWGSWKKYKKRFTEGISVISINTNKGRNIFNKILSNFSFVERLNQEEAIYSNDNFFHPVVRPNERSFFYKNLNSNYKLFIRTYLAKTYRIKVLKSIYGVIIPEKIRIFIKKIIH